MIEIKSKKHYHRTGPHKLLQKAIACHQKTSMKTNFIVKLSMVTVSYKNISRKS